MSQQLRFVDFAPAENKSELKRFVDFAWTVNAKDPAWVPPLKLQVLDNLDTKKNPFYKHAKIRLWNAYRGDEMMGRIAAIVDDAHNKFHDEKTGFWGFFECVNEQAVANALFEKAEVWAKAQGMKAIRGPMNPSTNHECGMLLTGFDRAPYVMMTHNPSYYPKLVDGAEYGKAKDLLAFEMPRPESFNERMVQVAELVKKKANVKFRPINMKNFKADVARIKEVYNDAWEKNWGFVPMDDAEFDHMAKSMKDILWPDFCILAEDATTGEAIGFSLALPDINQLLKEIPNGKLLPFGIFKLLTGISPKAKKINRVRVITLGVKQRYRTSGVANVFYYESFKQAEKLKLFGGECSWILEDNELMLSAINKFAGVPPYKTYRIYEKALLS